MQRRYCFALSLPLFSSGQLVAKSSLTISSNVFPFARSLGILLFVLARISDT